LPEACVLLSRVSRGIRMEKVDLKTDIFPVTHQGVMVVKPPQEPIGGLRGPDGVLLHIAAVLKAVVGVDPRLR